MAEKMMRVCDVDGAPATHTVRIQDGRTSWVKDLCDADFAQLIQGARKPRPGRRPGSTLKRISRKEAPATAGVKNVRGRRKGTRRTPRPKPGEGG